MRPFHWILRLLPRSFREDHAREILLVWAEEARGRDPRGRRRVWAAALRDTLRVAPREHAAAAWRNLRMAGRRLGRTPAFTGAAVLTLALGTGATAAVFTVLNAVVLRPLPWHAPHTVGIVWAVQPSGERTWLSVPELDHLRREAGRLAGVAGMTDLRLQRAADGTVEEVQALAVSHDFFDLLGVRPALGRDFVPEEDRAGAAPVALVSDAFWRTRLGADPRAVGRGLALNGTEYNLAGVLPVGFELLPASPVLPDAPDVFVALEPHLLSRAPNVRFLHALARLEPRATFPIAEAELTAQAIRLASTYPEAYPGGSWAFHLRPFHDEVLGSTRTRLVLLFGLVVLVLLMACANVANLLLARGEARRAELAVRTALGASPARLAGELLAEAFVLAAAGTLAGLCAAVAAPAIVRLVEPGALPRLETGPLLDLRLAAFAAILLLVTTAAFAILPVVERARLAPGAALTGSRGGGRTRRSALAARALVVGQSAFAAAILLTTFALLDGFLRLQATDLGFSPHGLLSARITRTAPTPGPMFFEDAVSRLEQSPLVARAAAITQLPLSGSALGSSFLVRQGDDDRRIDADLRGVTPGYFGVMGLPLLEGRDFSSADTADGHGVALVDEAFARRLRDGGAVIGSRFRWFRQPERELEIVGVVGSVRHRGPDQPVRETVYRPARQYPRDSMYLVARANGDPAAATPALRDAVRALDPAQPVADIMTMTERVSRSLARTRASTRLAAALAALSLALAAVGIYGLLSLSVAQRLREFGIRRALGAGRARILRAVAVQGVGLATAGALPGLALGTGLVHLARSTLFDLPAPTLETYVAAAGLILAAAGAAVWRPACRATRADPAVALRAEV